MFTNAQVDTVNVQVYLYPRVDIVSSLISDAGEQLTRTERRLAEAATTDPTMLAFGTISELAERMGTSRPSIVRFASKLGFARFADLQHHVRTSLSVHLSRPTDRIRQERSATALTRARAAMEEALDSVFEAATSGRVEAVAKRIAQAKAVWLVSGETSRAGAQALLSGLSMVHARVRLVDDRNMGSDLSNVAAGDVVVFIDFARYRRSVVQAAELLASAGANLVAITDSPLSPLAIKAQTWCEIRVPAIGPFDTSLSAVALAELIVAEVAHQLRGVATARIDRIEELWEATGTFHDEPTSAGRQKPSSQLPVR